MPGETLHIDDGSFEDTIKKYPLVVIDFWAAWCGPCRMVGPVIDKLAEEYNGKITFAKLNVDENTVIPSKFGVMSIPTILVFKNGEQIDRMVGAMPKQNLEQKLNQYL